uniref:Impact N-terminal domain-containing protein n=1 Tax=Leersia perrieri TaxID=77586 RepID=A0A0D9X8X7_9ORYZ
MAAVRVVPRLRLLPLLLPEPAAVHRGCSSCGGSSAAVAPAAVRAMSSSSSSTPSFSHSPYTTLVGRVSCEREIKKSKFIAIAAPVPDERAAMSFLNEVSDPRASHNCWAYKLGEQFRYNDDGEPSSTAGKPIYSAIISSDIDMVMVVVIRYFGGIKLGTGGLVRAYGGVASECLKDAPTCLVKPKARVGMEVPFDLLGTVYHQLQHYQAEDIKQDYDTGKDGTVMVMFKLEYEKIDNLGSAALLHQKYSAIGSRMVLNSKFRQEFPSGLVVFGGGDMNGIGGIWNPGMVGIVVGIVVGMDGIVVGIEGIGGKVTGIVGIVGMVVGMAGIGRDGIVPAAVGGMVAFGIGTDGIGGTVSLGTAGMEGIGGSVVGTVGMEG